MKIKLCCGEIEQLKSYKGVRPHRIKFQLTNACNAKCKVCSLRLIKKKDMLKSDTVIKTLNDLKILGCMEVDFTGGEPTLHPNLVDFIELSHKLGYRVKMNSNGYLIDERLAKSLVKAGLNEFAISIDSYDPQVHNQLRCLKDGWQRAIKAIQNTDKFRNEYHTDTKIILYSIIDNSNYTDTLKVLDLKKNANFDEINFIPIKNLENQESFLSAKQLDDFYQNIAPILIEKYHNYGFTGIFRTVSDPFEKLSSGGFSTKAGLYTEKIYQSVSCFVPSFYAYIISDGSVVPCCVAPHHLKPEYIMGNINEQSFDQIWNSDRFNAFRRSLAKPSYDICYCCSGHHTDFNRDVHCQIQEYDNGNKKN